MLSGSSKQLILGGAIALALAFSLGGCEYIDNGVDRVETGAAHVANWVSGTATGAGSGGSYERR
jgi:hypothetical protein